VNKEELSDQLNEILGLEEPIDFSRLLKEDLERLVEAFKDPKALIRLGVRRLRGKARERVMEYLIEEFLGRERDEGPLGFGILPRILKRFD